MEPIAHSIRRLLPPLLLALAVCLAWIHFQPHLGVHHRLASASHHRLPPLGFVQSLFLVFAAAAAAAFAVRAGLAGTFARVPESAIPWQGGRSLTREDLLAGAAFGAYGANRTAAVHPTSIVYRRAGPFLVVLGGACGETWAAAEAEAGFRRWAGRRPIVWYGAGFPAGAAIHIGQEAIVNLHAYRLDRPATANLRHSINRARRSGVGVVHGAWADLPPAVRVQLDRLERTHHRRHPLRLRLTLSTLADARDGRPWVVAVSPAGQVEAAVTWLPSGDGRGVVLDLMRRRDGSLPGAMDLVIHQGLESAREAGRAWASLGVVAGRSPAGLRRFKAKFNPQWHDRYIAAPGIPRLLAAAAAGWAHLAPWPAA